MLKKLLISSAVTALFATAAFAQEITLRLAHFAAET